MAEINFLEMSDDDLLKHAAPVLTEVEPEPVVEEQVEQEEQVEEAEVETPEVEAEPDEEELSEEEQAAAANLLAEPDDELGDVPPAAAKAKPKAAEAKPDKDAATESVAEKEAAAPAMTAEDFQAEILKPFKANGREMQVTSPEEARTLMQQGANYNKKMAEFKPHRALLKQLEQHDLLSEEKIGFLIDLSKKNPEAIGKLLKDSGIDPLDLDSDKVAGYKPNTYAVSEEQMNLDAVLDDLKDDEHFQPVIHAVANEWDVTSQKLIAATPDVLRVLAKQKESGVYDTITNEVERRKALGQLRNVPALHAYKQVGDEFEAAGKFAHLAPKPTPAATLPVKKTVAAKPAKPAESQAVIDKRKAAATTATAPAVKPALDDINILNLSDDEFAKLKLPV